MSRISKLRRPYPAAMRRPFRAVGRRQRTIENATANLAAQLGREPSDEEVAGPLAMSVQKLTRLRG